MHLRITSGLVAAAMLLTGCTSQPEAAPPPAKTTASPEFCRDLPAFNDHVTTYMAHSLGLMDGGSIDLVSLQQSSAAVASLGEKMAPTVPAEIVPQFGVVRKMVATSAAGVKPDWKASEIDIPMSDEQARAWEAVQLYKGC